MSKLLPELIIDILSRLPAKTLVRFKCASKSWRSLINGPYFIKTHLNRSIQTNTNFTLIVFEVEVDYGTPRNIFATDFDDDFDSLERLKNPIGRIHRTEILGSCNGLLCVSQDNENVFLWNPSIRKHKKLPDSPIERPPVAVSVCSSTTYGFGYDPDSDDYKVVRITQFVNIVEGISMSEVKVYSLKSNSWTRARDYQFNDFGFDGIPGMLVGNLLHWIATRREDRAELLVAFDLGSEKFRQLPKPVDSDDNSIVCLEVLGGCLCLCVNVYVTRNEVWLMKKYGVAESWTKVYTINQGAVPWIFEYAKPLMFSKSGEKVLLAQDCEHLLWYDIKRKRAKQARIRRMPRKFDAVISMRSLVPLDG